MVLCPRCFFVFLISLAFLSRSFLFFLSFLTRSFYFPSLPFPSSSFVFLIFSFPLCYATSSLFIDISFFPFSYLIFPFFLHFYFPSLLSSPSIHSAPCFPFINLVPSYPSPHLTSHLTFNLISSFPFPLHTHTSPLFPSPLPLPCLILSHLISFHSPILVLSHFLHPFFSSHFLSPTSVSAFPPSPQFFSFLIIGHVR